MDSTAFKRNAKPFLAMVLIEAGEVLMTTLTKEAMNKGISNYIYATLYNSLGVLILLPYFIFHTIRKRSLPITFALLRKCFLLGFFGRCLLMFSYIGIDYSSPVLTAALGNLTPVFTFLILLVFGMEKLNIRSASSQGKSLGTIITVSGAFIVTLYKGPDFLSEKISSNPNPSNLLLSEKSQTLYKGPDFLSEKISSNPNPSNLLLSMSKQSKWIFGGLFLAFGYLFLAIWNVLQAQTVKKYPDKTTVVFYFMLFGSIQVAVFSCILERDLNAWVLHHNVEIIAILYSAIFGTAIRHSVITWCLKEKGPLYVALFKPLGMVLAEIGGIFFLGDKLHLGSIIGAVTISVGFYIVMWGNAKEENQIDPVESTDQSTPLLQNKPNSDQLV